MDDADGCNMDISWSLSGFFTFEGRAGTALCDENMSAA
jgi:hypothetical protein